MSESEERWRPVADFDGLYESLYEVSDLGRVRSLDRYTRGRYGPRLSRGRILRPGRSGRYLTVALSPASGPGRSLLVSWLVLRAFVGPRPADHHALHGPGGPLDNRLVNLRWGTRSENLGLDRVRDGTDNRGEKCATVKLTAAIVTEMRLRYNAGETQHVLAAQFSVSGPTASNAISGNTWAWLPGAVPVDPKRHGKQGEAHHAAKLTPAIIRECRARHAMGENQRSLAREFGVSQASLQKAITGQTWRGV